MDNAMPTRHDLDAVVPNIPVYIIILGLPETFPRHLGIEEQGRFAISIKSLISCSIILIRA